jgi:hypothetical protein
MTALQRLSSPRSRETRLDSDENRARFIIEFAGLELNRLRPKAWRNLHRQLWEFFDWSTSRRKRKDETAVSPVTLAPTDLGDPGRIDAAVKAVVSQLQRELASTLAGWADGQLAGEPSTVTMRLIPAGASTVLALGNTRDVFLMELLPLLVRQRAHIARCIECAHAFYRSRPRQKFCHRRCFRRAHERTRRRQHVREQPRGQTRKVTPPQLLYGLRWPVDNALLEEVKQAGGVSNFIAAVPQRRELLSRAAGRYHALTGLTYPTGRDAEKVAAAGGFKRLAETSPRTAEAIRQRVRRVEVGERCDDVPISSLPWLLEQGDVAVS